MKVGILNLIKPIKSTDRALNYRVYNSTRVRALDAYKYVRALIYHSTLESKYPAAGSLKV